MLQPGLLNPPAGIKAANLNYPKVQFLASLCTLACKGLVEGRGGELFRTSGQVQDRLLGAAGGHRERQTLHLPQFDSRACFRAVGGNRRFTQARGEHAKLCTESPQVPPGIEPATLLL